MDSAWLDVGPYGNVGIVTGTCIGINAMETSVEEVVETLMDAVCLAKDNCVTFCGRMADSSYGVDLYTKGEHINVNM